MSAKRDTPSLTKRIPCTKPKNFSIWNSLELGLAHTHLLAKRIMHAKQIL